MALILFAAIWIWIGFKLLFSIVNSALMGSALLAFGALLYAAVGIFVLLVWVFSSHTAPDMIGAFSLGVPGWLGGALAAVFRKHGVQES